MESWQQGQNDLNSDLSTFDVTRVLPDTGMLGLLQALKEKNAKVGPDKPAATGLHLEAEDNPAGMTTQAAADQVQSFVQGGAAPNFDNTAPDTKAAFRSRVLQGLRRAQRS